MKQQIGPYTLDIRKGKTIVHSEDRIGTITIYGNGHEHEIFYSQPEWSDDLEAAFVYKGETYYLADFMSIERHAPAWMQAYDGCMSDSFFSGILITYSDEYCEAVKVYTYIA